MPDGDGSAVDFSAHCLKAAERFVQTVVIADNQARLDDDTSGERKRAQRGRRSSPSSAVREAETLATEKPREAGSSDEHILKLPPIVNGFASRGITCGSYLPTERDPEDEVLDTTRKVVRPSDVSIIDWQLKDGNPKIAIDVIREILSDDEKQGGRLRLIIVYTGEDDLNGAASDLEKALGGLATRENGAEPPLLTTQHARIRFFNKPAKRREYAGAAGSGAVVRWEDLPARCLEEFKALSHGLLQSYALHCLAAVREDAHRIIAQFHPDLDGAYVGQRASIPDPADAADLMHDIMLSEFAITLGDTKLQEKSLGSEPTVLWLREKMLRDTIAQITPVGHEVVEKIDNGIREKLVQNGLHHANEKNKIKLICSFNPKEERSEEINEHFSVLSSISHHSGDTPPRPTTRAPHLTLGTLISDDDHIYMCLQPKCDTVRLTGSESFLFVQLTPSHDGRFDLIVPRGNQRLRLVVPRTKPTLELIKFRIEENATAVIGADGGNGSWKFYAADGKTEWAWVADVRELHVISFFNRIAANLTRPGLTQSEWLRLKNPKPK